MKKNSKEVQSSNPPVCRWKSQKKIGLGSQPGTRPVLKEMEALVLEYITSQFSKFWKNSNTLPEGQLRH
jgi:hypothetical protein